MAAIIIDLHKPDKLWKARTAICARQRLAEFGATDAQSDEIIKQMLALATDMPAALRGDEATAFDFYERVVTGVAEWLWRRLYEPRTSTILSSEAAL
jgi:hypothetical protein